MGAILQARVYHLDLNMSGLALRWLVPVIAKSFILQVKCLCRFWELERTYVSETCTRVLEGILKLGRPSSRHPFNDKRKSAVELDKCSEMLENSGSYYGCCCTKAVELL